MNCKLRNPKNFFRDLKQNWDFKFNDFVALVTILAVMIVFGIILLYFILSGLLAFAFILAAISDYQKLWEESGDVILFLMPGIIVTWVPSIHYVLCQNSRGLRPMIDLYESIIDKTTSKLGI